MKKYAVIASILGIIFFTIPNSASAAPTMVTVTCGNTAGESRDFRIGWDNTQEFFKGRGYIPRLFCEGGYAQGFNEYVRDDLADASVGYYNGVAINPAPAVETTAPTPQPSPTETTAPTPQPSETTAPSPQPEPTPTETTAPSPQPTPTETTAESPQPTPTPSESATVVETPTAIVDPQPTPPAPASEPVVVAPAPVIEPPAPPAPVEEPAPPALAPEPAPVEPPAPTAPEPEPIPAPEPPAPAPESPVVEPEPPAPAPEPPVIEPAPPAPAPVAPVEPSPIEQALPIGSVDVASLPADTLVELDNGVILTAGVITALQLFDDPTQILSAIFTDPGQALTALLNVGADMSPEVRAKAQKTVLASVIAGGIATQSAMSVAAGYRRKP